MKFPPARLFTPAVCRRRFALVLTCAAHAVFSMFCAGEVRAGDKEEIFPPEPAAQKAIHWENGYFVVNGQPTFINSGSIHYARVPRELWEDRIWRLKQMGFNCAQSYVFWNATEPREGQWNLTDNLDLNAWLSTLQKMGMYALVRPGPYACAEWEEGGYPAWLSIKPGMVQREMGPVLAYSDPYMDKMEEIVARHQVNRGGNVFLLQLENEHSRGWGTQVDDPYLQYLDDQARRNGIEIPMFNSGLHHSHDPSGETPFPPGASPWYSTEFWTGWIGKYGEMPPGTQAEKTRGSWKAIAFGGAGYNYYMAHGGTNFGYSGDSSATSYDYSAPIGEAGQLRGFYFLARRAALFAQSFTPLLTGSHNDPNFAKSDLPQLRVTTRTNPGGGSIVFVDHFQRKDAPVAPIAPEAGAYHAPKADPDAVLEAHVTAGGMTFPRKGTLKVGPLEPRTILVNLPWADGAVFESVCTNVLLRKTIGTVDYWVCYGAAGDAGEITLKRKSAAGAPTPIEFTYPTDASVKEIDLDSGGGHHGKLLVMNTEMTNRTWLAGDKLYTGPAFVLADGGIEFAPEGGTATIYSATGKSQVTQPPVAPPALPALAGWLWRDAAVERVARADAAGWLKSEGPQPMESYDGFQNRYGWYHTTLRREVAGPVSLRFAGSSGTPVAFLNGQPANLDELPAKAGDNRLDILVKAGARPKSTYNGPVGKKNARGLWGGVSEDKAPAPLDVAWKRWTKPARDAKAEEIAQPGYDDSTWQAVDPATLTTKLQASRGSSWYRGTFTVAAGQLDSLLETPAFGRATINVYLNGKLLDDRIADVSKILVPGKNTVLLEIQSRLGEDTGMIVLSLWHSSPLTRGTWYFRSGLDHLDETEVIGRVTNWSAFLTAAPWQTGEPALPHAPAFWKCTFTYQRPAGLKETLGLLTDGLKAGHVWLNGHNLGESPQPVPMYLPECWLRDGPNDLVVFDLQGATPAQLQLSRYEAFSIVSGK